jgi:enamine deaminase RidA (YjgF/YER057c/UK114 family)
MTIERYPSDFANFSDAVVVSGPGRWINVSGQVGFDEDMKVVAGGVKAETHATFDAIERVLAKTGADLSHVIRITVFMTDLADYAQFSEARSERWPENPPASAAVQVAGLLVGAQIEIDALAFVPEDG